MNSYFELVLPGECLRYVYSTTPLSVFKKKRAKNGSLARKMHGATNLKPNLKLSMHAQLDTGSNMGWVPPGHTSPYGHVHVCFCLLNNQKLGKL